MELDDEMKLYIRRAARPRGANHQTPACEACSRCLYCGTAGQDRQKPHRCPHGQRCLMSNLTGGPVCAHCVTGQHRVHAKCYDDHE